MLVSNDMEGDHLLFPSLEPTPPPVRPPPPPDGETDVLPIRAPRPPSPDNRAVLEALSNLEEKLHRRDRERSMAIQDTLDAQEETMD